MLEELLESALLLIVILNPFLMTLYLLDLVRSLDTRAFLKVLARASVISGVVFAVFALSGDAIFSRVLHVRSASFAIFGGVIFLIIAIRFVLRGPSVIEELRGPPAAAGGSIAMPFMIGPGTINASILAGSRLPGWAAVAAVALGVSVTLVVVVALKMLHDGCKDRNEKLVERYVDMTGRVSALVMGTISIEMIATGIELLRKPVT